MFLELFLNTMLNNVDMLMLSHYDEYAVGAVGNANNIMFMMNILFNVIATATSVVVAQYLGAKQFGKMNMIYSLAVVVNLAVGIALSGAFCAANPLIMDLLNVSAEMRPHAMIYIYIVGGGGCLIRNFGEYDPNRVTINDDIRATAKGFEFLANLKLKKANAA